jgi:UrcA family protein
MKRLVLIAGFAAALASPAVAQSYKCVSGELLGGPEGYSCETNAQGEIVSVRPGKSTQTTTRTATRSAPTTRTVTRSATTTHSAPHTHGSNSHNHTHTHTDGTRHSHPHSHGAQHTSHRAAPTVTRTTSRPAPRQRLSYTPPKRPVPRPLPTCDTAYTRLPDTKDGRRQIEVCYADLTPVTVATADSVYARIKSAARKACRGQGFSRYGTNRSCERGAVYDAVMDVNLPALDSLYAQKSGKRIPRVKVGQLRRN